MSTPDIPDDELDDFFRKSLGNPDLDFREEDWLKMEQQLHDKQAREKAIFRRFLYSLLGIVLLLMPVVTWYMVTQSATASKPRLAVATEENKVSTADTTTDTNTATSPYPAANMSEVEKADGHKADKPASGPKPDQANPSASTRTEKTTQPLSTPQQHELSIKDRPSKAVPATQTITSTRQQTIEKQPQNSKEPETQKSNPIDQDLLASKPETDANRKQIISRKNEERATNPPLPNKSDKSLPLDLALNQPKKLGSDANPENQKGKETNSITNNPALDNSPVAKHEQKPFTNKTIPGKNKPVVSFPDLNQPDAELVEKAGGTPGQYAATNPFRTIVPIETIPGPSTQLLSYETHLIDLISEHIRQRQAAELASVDSTKRNKLAIERFPARVSVNLLFSPDLSSIGFSEIRPRGTNLGISVEYHISSKISVLVGAIYSTKIYAADAKKYNPDNPYWASYYPKPIDVQGTCKVIDLPVNIRYNFLRNEKYNLYLSGGLSSYLMLREDYKYTYKVYDPNLRPGWQGKNKYKHLFKVINISAGYERKLNQKFSLQAEPFIKLPTAGVGYGRIKLLSTGLFVSMKYNF